MSKKIVFVCFFIPYIISCLYIQALAGTFVSVNLAQLIAYGNPLLIILGVFLIKNHVGKLSKTTSLWFFFYAIYYSLGLLATGIHGFDSAVILASLISVFYFIGFYFLLSNEEYLKSFFKVATISFLISTFLTILLHKLNYSVKLDEIPIYALNRAGGINGDANEAAMCGLIAYVLFNYFYIPKRRISKIFKSVIILLIFYSIVITFSTTGLSCFIVIFLIMNYKFFTGIKLILSSAVAICVYASLFFLKPYTHQLDLSEAQINKINNLINLLTLNFSEVDSSGRGDLAKNLLPHIYENPFLGNGIDFSVVLRGHNTYLNVIGDAGIFTFLIFITILLIYILKSFKVTIPIRYLCLSVVLVLCIFMYSLQSILNKPYLMVLFIFIGYLIDQENPELIMKKSKQSGTEE